MQLAPIYGVSSGPPPYLMAACQPTTGPWCAIYLAADQAQDLAQLGDFAGILSQLENQDDLTVVAVLFFEQPIGSGAGLETLVGVLESYDWGQRYGGGFFWLGDPGQVTDKTVIQAAPQLQFVAAPNGPNTNVNLVTPGQTPLLALAPRPATDALLLEGDAVLVRASGDGGAAQLSAGALSIAHGPPGQPIAVASLGPVGAPTVTIPLTGAHCGDLSISGALVAPISDLGVAFRFGFGAAGAAPLNYPLLDDPAGLDGWPFSATLSPGAPLDPARCAWSLSPSTAPLDSGFRTLTRQTVALRPAGAQLVFNTIGGQLYLTPSGPFALSVAGVAEGGAIQLACGISGTEHIELLSGDKLVFAAGHAAAVTAQLLNGPAPPWNVIFELQSNDASQQTAWVSVQAADGRARSYYAEPDQGLFFSAAAAGDLSLDPLLLSRATIGPTTPAVFPLVPYGALTPGAGPYGEDAGYLAAFECQALNPVRRGQIEAARPVPAPIESGTLQAVTEQGYVASVTAGAWTALDIAADCGRGQVSIGFKASGAALQGALQDAFLSNQQFLVISQPDPDFAAAVTLDGWPFSVDLTKNVTVGDYRNVLLFKSGDFTIRQMAARPSAWSRYDHFNDAAQDPDGVYISGWLVSYLDEATRLAATVPSLAAFRDLIDDPAWSGFLALKVDVETATLPPPIQALVAGIDKSQFYAHHLGCAGNHVSWSTSGYAIASPVFALVRYQAPSMRADATGAGGYQESSQTYDFQVLTLEAVFEGGALHSFTSKSRLLLNSLFGDTINPTDPTGAVAGCNTLLLLGDYRVIDEAAVYTFATASGAVSDFYPSSNAFSRIEIAQATMTVGQADATAADATTSYVATFAFSGDCSFACAAGPDAPAFDLLSYAALAFQGLCLDMSFTSGGDDRTFAFDMSRLAPVQNRSWIVADDTGPAVANGLNLVRAGSLAAQFPLTVTGLVAGAADPSSQGFRPLTTQSPQGVNIPQISGAGWYALTFRLNLGGQGALGPSALLSADLMLAWTPGGPGGAPSVAPLIRVSGPGGADLSFDLEGVVKLGAADVVLNREGPAAGPGPFVLGFESIGLSVLMLSFPPRGCMNIYLFGDPGAQPGQLANPTLGWFGGYVEKPAAPPTTAEVA